MPYHSFRADSLALRKDRQAPFETCFSHRLMAAKFFRMSITTSSFSGKMAAKRTKISSQPLEPRSVSQVSISTAVQNFCFTKPSNRALRAHSLATASGKKMIIQVSTMRSFPGMFCRLMTLLQRPIKKKVVSRVKLHPKIEKIDAVS